MYGARMQQDHPQDSFWWQHLSQMELNDSRGQILAAAYREIHRHGFQSASLSRILAQTGLTKGALYHHFPNKTELGYAVIDEIVGKKITMSFIEPFAAEQNPIDVMIEMIRQAGSGMTLDDVNLGCPLNNLSQEMAPIEEGFRQRLEQLYEDWRKALADAFERAQQRGEIRTDVDSKSLAVLIVATLDGCMSTAKTAQSLDLLIACGGSLITYLEQLRHREENTP